jgi:hypothetical protein
MENIINHYKQSIDQTGYRKLWQPQSLRMNSPWENTDAGDEILASAWEHR